MTDTVHLNAHTHKLLTKPNGQLIRKTKHCIIDSFGWGLLYFKVYYVDCLILLYNIIVKKAAVFKKNM